MRIDIATRLLMVTEYGYSEETEVSEEELIDYQYNRYLELLKNY